MQHLFFHKWFRYFSSLLLSLVIFATPFFEIYAASIPSVSKVASKLEKRYNVNLESIKNAGQSFNVSNTKKNVPEVSLFFSTPDPKSGQKITARALPVYFSNSEESLYYTWYLKRKDCNANTCDYNGDGKYNSKDWRIEAATLLVQNGFDSVEAGMVYAGDTDSDGYKARFGGDNKEGKNDYCGVYDTRSGEIYELADTGSNTTFSCPAGKYPACMDGEVGIDPVTSQIDSSMISPVTPFSETPVDCFAPGGCSPVGTPVCTGGSIPACANGIPCCVDDPAASTSCSAPLAVCNAVPSANVGNLCKHVFADSPVGSTGDGVFGVNEEQFWKTNPDDPSTANNGNKDEANVVGFGLSDFSWTYFAGDQVGVAVEGTSLIPTKHDDSSYLVMWAFPKNRCMPSLVGANTGEYVQNVKGYPVTFPTTNLDPNDCIELNLIDPTEGGQPTNLEVNVTASPTSLVNDESADGSGDVAFVQATINNATRESSSIRYKWSIELSDNPRFSNSNNITAGAVSAELVRSVEGSGLDQLSFKLDMKPALLGALSGRSGYIRFRVRVEEDVDGGGVRKGKSDVIVKFTSIGKRIVAYRVDPVVVGANTHVKLHNSPIPKDNFICEDTSLERSLCRVVKNEVVGLKIDGAGLKDFSWQVNRNPLTCTKQFTSPDCLDGAQGNIAFLPITGEVGDSYDVSVTANTVSGETITISRVFHVVEPFVTIVSDNKATAWPKLLGFYRDVLGKADPAICPSGMCPDYSDNALQAFQDSSITLKAVYVPGFLGAASGLEKVWMLDDDIIAETAPNTIDFPINKAVGATYDVSFKAFSVQADLMRRALHDVWGISPLDSTEIRFTGSVQVEVQSNLLAEGNQKGITKYYALLSSYIPETLLFTIRMFLIGTLLLFCASFVSSLSSRRKAYQE